MLTAAEGIWYLILCIAWGGGHLRKVPVKEALDDAGLVTMTSGEGAWYLLFCIYFGAGHLMKVPIEKARSELPALPPRAASPLTSPTVPQWARSAGARVRS